MTSLAEIVQSGERLTSIRNARQGDLIVNNHSNVFLIEETRGYPLTIVLKRIHGDMQPGATLEVYRQGDSIVDGFNVTVAAFTNAYAVRPGKSVKIAETQKPKKKKSTRQHAMT